MPVFQDNNFTLTNTADPTKSGWFSLGSLTTSTRRRWVPPDADTTLAGLAVAQTFTKAQTITPDSDITALTLTFPAAGAQSPLLIQASDMTAKLRLDVDGKLNISGLQLWNGGIDTGSSAVFDVTALTTNRTISLPDADCLLMYEAAAVTSGRVLFASTGAGQAVGDADMTFATDTLTVTKISVARRAYVAKTANYTATTTDHIVNCTSGSFTITLPTAVSVSGKEYIIKNSGTGTITVATTSSQTIDGLTTQTVASLEALYVASDGANWMIL